MLALNGFTFLRLRSHTIGGSSRPQDQTPLICSVRFQGMVLVGDSAGSNIYDPVSRWVVPERESDRAGADDLDSVFVCDVVSVSYTHLTLPTKA